MPINKTTKPYERNYSGWVHALRDVGVDVKKLCIIDDRLGDLHRLLNSKLPTYEHLFVSSERIVAELPNVTRITKNRQKSLVARFIPYHDECPRETIIDVDISAIIKKAELLTVPQMVVINEYDPAEFSGAIISSGQELLIEVVASPTLDVLTHGKITPWSADFSEQHGIRIVRHRFNTPTEVRSLIWKVIRQISKCEDAYGIPKYQVLEGYFEFVKSKESKQLFFIDYKVSAPSAFINLS